MNKCEKTLKVNIRREVYPTEISYCANNGIYGDRIQG